MNILTPPKPEGGGVGRISILTGKELFQRILPPGLSDSLKALSNETAKPRIFSGIVSDGAFMCDRHHFDFGGNLLPCDCEGIFAREEGTRPVKAPV